MDLERLNQLKIKIQNIRKEYEALSLKDQLYSTKGASLNRAIAKYKKLKSEYFYG